MRVLGIDPGTDETAMVMLDDGKICWKALLSNAEALDDKIFYGVDFPQRVAVEMVACYGMPVGREVFETAVLIGRLLAMWEGRIGRENVSRVYRKDVKINLCGSMKAKDSNIRQALIDRIGEVGTKSDPGPCYGMKADLWAALAVAVTFHDSITKTP